MASTSKRSHSKTKFDSIPFTKVELVQWQGFLKWLIVNTFTLGTIFVGFILLVVPTPFPKFLNISDQWMPLVLAGIAVFCDIADGKLARAWQVQSKVGATFDGLADMMAFGIGPPIYYALNRSNIYQDSSDSYAYFPLFAVTLFVGASVYRISRFLVLTFSYYNGTFKGMPTNVAGCAVHISLAIFGVDHWCQPWMLCCLGILMVSAVPFEKPSFLKDKSRTKESRTKESRTKESRTKE